ncbi:aminoacyl-tRNA deacylase [Thermomonospora amylolytica]|uniref:aminoacyl-tRNA deacylase n=1 Tax=Thermomonospora amylolytica TaxID=1411117 RepID=UPI000E6D5510|nr:YbaK/EbsC family protein [Thermomonospora amylolytica]
MKDALAIHRALLEREIPHEIVRLRHPVSRADDLPHALGLAPGRCLAVRMFGCAGAATGERFLAAVITLAGGTPPLERIRRAVGARLVRPARPDLVNSITDYAADLVCPLLLPDTVPVLADQDALGHLPDEEIVYTATGEGWTALAVRLADVYALSRAEPMGQPREPLGMSASVRAG